MSAPRKQESDFLVEALEELLSMARDRAEQNFHQMEQVAREALVRHTVRTLHAG